MEELFDVVDGEDRVIGQRPRPEVHRLGLRHRAVHVFIFNARGDLFLQKRSQFKDTFPGAWDSSCSGHLQPGESYDAGAARELREELGLRTAKPLERIFKVGAGARTGQEFVWLYRGEAEGPFTLPPEEIETGGWFAPAQLDRWLTERPGDFAEALPLLWTEYKKTRL
jgi:isopentenyl-diphosphate delta-isomerase type 1